MNCTCQFEQAKKYIDEQGLKHNENCNMNYILAITITYNRLELTQRYLGELIQKAGYPYRHIVVDNGSSDGTPAWLKAQGYEVIENSENVGIMKAVLQAYAKAIELYGTPKYILKFDNDCEIITNNILAKLVEFMRKADNKVCLAPTDLNISAGFLPKLVEPEEMLFGEPVRITTHIGGMFSLIPLLAMEALIAKGGVEKDIRRGAFWRKRGFKCVYLQNIFVKHKGKNKSEKSNYKF